MKFGAQWSVKGIRPEARETALEAARRSGMSLGDWLNSVILNTASQPGPDSDDHYDEGGGEDVTAVQSRLDDLSRRVESLTRRGPEAYAPPQHRQQQQQQYAPQPYLPAAPTLAPAPMPNWAGRIDNAVAEIAARRRALNGEPALQPRPAPIAPPPVMRASPVAPAPMPEPPAIIRAPMPAQDLSGLEEQLRQITDRIDTLRTPGVEEAIHELRGELAQIGHSLNDAMPRQAIDAIERQIQGLTARIAEGRQAGVDGNTLAGIEQGLAEVRDALYQLTPAESLAGFSEAIHGLDQKLDYIVAQKDPATLQQLEDSITTLRQVAGHIASNDAVSKVASDVAMLAEKIDRLAHAATGSDALSGLEQRIAALSDALAARSQAGATVPPKLEALVGSLSEKIEKLQGSRGDTIAFGHLEDRIVKLVEKLDASDSRLAHLEAIERGLGDLLVHIEEMRAQKGDSTGLRNGVTGGVDTLKQDIARTQNEIEAVHGTLGQLMDRLATIERNLLNQSRDEAAPMKVPGKLAVRAVPEPPAPPPQPVEQHAPEPVAPPPLPPPPPQPVAVTAPPAPPEPAKRPLPRAKTLPIDPDLPPDLPLEPGSGPPRVRPDPAARIAASEAALGNAGPAAADAPQGKSGFIAAARRAAQAAMKDKPVRAPAASSLPEVLELADESATKRLSKRIKSLFVAASVIAIVVGGFEIASNQLDLFQPDDGKPAQMAAQTPAAASDDTDAGEGEGRDVTASTPAAPAAPRMPGMIPPTSPYGFIMPPATTFPAAVPSQGAASFGDVTGALSPSSHSKANPTAPSVAAPQSVMSEEIPIAIGSAALRNAAKKGDAAAAYEIAVRFAEGRGVAASAGDAARWFERAAQAGLAPAQFRLGSLYEKGQGVKKNIEKARQNYLAAAAQGNAKAMHNLAVLYAEGIGDKPDFASAVQWFQKAAAHGVADSQYNLAVLYARGLGVGKNLGESYKWFALAAAQGDKEAARKRDEVAIQIDAKALAAAKQAVKTWTAAPQPAAAVTVPQPSGGWDAASPAAAPSPPKARASTAVRLGRR
jgi:localization factor PodJL